MLHRSPLRAAFALAALLAAASCDHNPAVPARAPGEADLATSVSLPAVPGFTARANLPGTSPRKITFSWQDVAGEDVFLIQWRVGDAGSWRSLVTTGRNHTSFGTDSVRGGERNYYRIAAMTSAYQKGPFTTVLPTPIVRASSAQILENQKVRLQVTFVNPGLPLSYLVEYGTDPGLTDAVRTPGITSPDYQGSRLFEIPVVPGTTYYYRAGGEGDGVTVHDSIRTFVASHPHAPVLQATFHLLPFVTSIGAGPPGYRVELTWTQPGAAAASYRVYRRILGQPEWLLLTQPLSALERRYIDRTISISSAQTYEYRVQACGVVCSIPSEAQVVTAAMPAPADFVVTHTRKDSVLLQWGDLADEEGFAIQRRSGVASQNWETIATVGKSRVSAVVRVVTGKVNYFRVAGTVTQGRVGMFASSDALTWPAVIAQTGWATVLPPASATVSGFVSFIGLPSTAWFEWSTQRDPCCPTATPPVPVDSGATVSATINFPTTGTYYYRIVASNGQVTARGGMVEVKVGLPSPPVLTTASFSLPEHAVHLTWTHSGNDLSYFKIARNGVGQEALTADMRSLYDVVSRSSVLSRTQSYAMGACNAANQCEWSATMVVGIPAMSAPSGVTATRQSDGKVRLQWLDLPGGQEYAVQWRTSATGWRHVVTTATNSTSYITSLVTAGTTNYYRVAGFVAQNTPGPFTETSLVVP